MQGLGQLRSELSVQRAVQKYVPRVLRGVIVAFPNRDASKTESVQICLKSTETSEKLRGDVGRRKPYHCDYTMNIRCWGMLRGLHGRGHIRPSNKAADTRSAEFKW